MYFVRPIPIRILENWKRDTGSPLLHACFSDQVYDDRFRCTVRFEYTVDNRQCDNRIQQERAWNGKWNTEWHEMPTQALVLWLLLLMMLVLLLLLLFSSSFGWWFVTWLLRSPRIILSLLVLSSTSDSILFYSIILLGFVTGMLRDIILPLVSASRCTGT